MRKLVLMIGSFLLAMTSHNNLYARSYFLPDYNPGAQQRTFQNPKIGGNNTVEECEGSYTLLDNHKVIHSKVINGKTCYLETKCKSDFKTCGENQIGSGGDCQDSEGTKYANCECPSGWTTCDKPADGSRRCAIGGTNVYESCCDAFTSTCDAYGGIGNSCIYNGTEYFQQCESSPCSGEGFVECPGNDCSSACFSNVTISGISNDELRERQPIETCHDEVANKWYYKGCSCGDDYMEARDFSKDFIKCTTEYTECAEFYSDVNTAINLENLLSKYGYLTFVNCVNESNPTIQGERMTHSNFYLRIKWLMGDSPFYYLCTIESGSFDRGDFCEFLRRYQLSDNSNNYDYYITPILTGYVNSGQLYSYGCSNKAITVNGQTWIRPIDPTEGRYNYCYDLNAGNGGQLYYKMDECSSDYSYVAAEKDGRTYCEFPATDIYKQTVKTCQHNGLTYSTHCCDTSTYPYTETTNCTYTTGYSCKDINKKYHHTGCCDSALEGKNFVYCTYPKDAEAICGGYYDPDDCCGDDYKKCKDGQVGVESAGYCDTKYSARLYKECIDVETCPTEGVDQRCTGQTGQVGDESAGTCTITENDGEVTYYASCKCDDNYIDASCFSGGSTDCATLGYNEDSCSGNSLKCPFGNKYLCLN